MRYESDYYAYNPYNPNTALKQHGTLGMKWGKWNEETRARRLRERRGRASKVEISGSRPGLLNKITSHFSKQKEEPHLKRTHLTKELANISDEELNAAIKRMQLEQTYLNMLRQYPNASDKGKKYTEQFSDELFKNLSNGLGGAMGRRVAKAIDDWMNDEDKEKRKKEQAEKKYREEASKQSTETLQKANTREAAINNYVQNQMKKNK